MSLNVVNLVGRVGGEPDVKFFDSGSTKCKLTLAVKRPTKDSDQPDWFNLELWGNEARIAADYVHKGSLIGVQGFLKFETWSDRATGAERSSPIIQVNRLHLLGSKQDNNASTGAEYREDEF